MKLPRKVCGGMIRGFTVRVRVTNRKALLARFAGQPGETGTSKRMEVRNEVKVREFGVEDVRIFPPAPGKCPICAADHPAEFPHNKDSLYYQMRFWQEHGRFPTWKDAAAHCSDEMKRAFMRGYAERGIVIDVGLDDGDA